MTITDKYNARVDEINSLVCVGLDSRFARLPERFKYEKQPQFLFNQWVIDKTAKYAAAFKINTAFYESRGKKGWEALQMTMQYLQVNYPEIITIADAKRADIGNTNLSYVSGMLDILGFDAITVHPYLGGEALAPFLERSNKATIVLTRTTNPGAGEFQDLETKSGAKVWEVVAQNVVDNWNEQNNCWLMMGATYPEDVKKARTIAPEMTFLVPGLGYQGGDVEKVITWGKTDDGKGLVVNSSRGIIFSDEPGEAAKALRDEINRWR